MQKNQAYDPQSFRTPYTEVDSNWSDPDKATSSRQRMLPLLGLTTAVAIVALIVAVVGVILGGIAVTSLQQELISLKEELALIHNGENRI